MYWKSLVLIIAMLLIGCSSSSDSGSSITYQDVAGFWKVEYIEDGERYIGMMALTSDGKAVINDLYNVIYGTAKVENGQLIITGDFYDDTVFSVVVKGAANTDKMNMNAVSSAGNQSFIMSRSQEHKDLYNMPSSLNRLAGTYSDDPDFLEEIDISGTATVDIMGNMIFTAATNCTVTGKISTINSRFNEYNSSLDTAGCTEYFSAGTYDGVAFEYKNSNGNSGLFVSAVSKPNDAIWFIGVK